MRNSLVRILLFSTLALTGAAGSTNRLRYPVSLVISPDGRTGFTANSRSGSISIINLKQGRLHAEHPIGGSPTDLAIHPQGEFLAVTDGEKHQLHFLKISERSLETLAKVKTVRHPARVLMAADGVTVAVSSIWDRQLAVYEATQRKDRIHVHQLHSVEMPFPLREMLPLAGGKQLVLADAFGGRIAVFETHSGSVLSLRTLPGHNIRGLALHPTANHVLVSHQILNPIARTTFNDIHWGVLMANVVRSIPVATLIDPQTDILAGSRLYRLGMSGPAAGDPAGIAVGESGQTVIALSGINAVETGWPLHKLTRLATGRRPADIQIHQDRAYVLNTFSDSVTTINLVNLEAEAEIPLGKQGRLTAIDRGEQLFFDARLSHNGWMSCHSCHPDGHSNGQLNDNLSDGSFTTPKRVLSLLGGGQTSPWAWNGSSGRLDEQVIRSIAHTMHGTALSEAQVGDLTAYLESLPPPPLRTQERTPERIVRGESVFTKHDCVRCHKPPLYTSAEIYQVGLKDELGRDEFNPPSLRGVSHRRHFFHDGRAETLFQVFGKHRHQLKQPLSATELLDLVAFLKSL